MEQTEAQGECGPHGRDLMHHQERRAVPHFARQSCSIGARTALTWIDAMCLVRRYGSR